MLVTPVQFARKIQQFYRLHGRKDLPWQQNPTPYRVWISEIMLQQTQVKTVIPYYQKFMLRFTSLQALASADIDEVLHHWQGLGYYSRARNLHACAQKIMLEFDGQFPTNLEAMQSLPGIGRSTAGAILSLAMNQSTPILDGNVKRVLARVFLVDGWYGQTAVAKQLWELSERYTPQKNTNQFNQAMMDLGASLCSRSKPSCESCPLVDCCLAYVHGKTSEYPHRKPKKAIPLKYADMLLNVNKKSQLLLSKRPPVGIWGGLWSLPEINWSESQASDLPGDLVDEFKHTFTHFQLMVRVVSNINDKASFNAGIAETSDLQWHNIDQLAELAFPTPIKKFLFRYFQLS